MKTTSFFRFFGEKNLKKLLLTLFLMVFSACAAETPPQAISVTSTIQRPTRGTYGISSLEIPTEAKLITPTPGHNPWETDFVNPILESIDLVPPNFHDDFTNQLNHGWYYINSNNPRKPYFANLQEDALILQIPGESNRKVSMVYNPKLARKNLLLSMDFKFGKSQPDDIVRFQFDQTDDQSVFLDLSKDESADIRWSLHTNEQLIAGTYYYFGPEFINAIVIMRENECAVLINQIPFAYLKDCRNKPTRQPQPESTSIQLLSTTGDPAIVTIDNVKLWDLDELLK